MPMSNKILHNFVANISS